MAGLMGGKPKTPAPPPPPKPVRQPTPADPELQRAGARAQSDAMRRSGRLSTILTDQAKEVTGSSGQKLGA
jgi:hypothetical protein